MLSMSRTMSDYEKLAEKVQQQEALITQLMSIIAVTNRKVHELSQHDKQSDSKKNFSHV